MGREWPQRHRDLPQDMDKLNERRRRAINQLPYAALCHHPGRTSRNVQDPAGRPKGPALGKPSSIRPQPEQGTAPPSPGAGGRQRATGDKQNPNRRFVGKSTARHTPQTRRGKSHKKKEIIMSTASSSTSGYERGETGTIVEKKLDGIKHLVKWDDWVKQTKISVTDLRPVKGSKIERGTEVGCLTNSSWQGHKVGMRGTVTKKRGNSCTVKWNHTLISPGTGRYRILNRRRLLTQQFPPFNTVQDRLADAEDSQT